MLPSAAMNEVPDVLRGYAVLAAHVPLAGSIGDGVANVHHLGLGQLGVAVVLSLGLAGAETGSGWITVAALAGAVGVVLRNGAKKQMIRVTARRVVTAMADTHAPRNLSACQCIRDSMGCVCSISCHAERAIAPRIRSASPRPALGRFANLDFGPKARMQARFNHVFIVAEGCA